MALRTKTGPGFAALAILALASPAMAQDMLSLRRADGAATPVMAYAARGGAACPPTMVVSHGFGGSETGHRSLAEAMSARGWRVLVMGHRESGRDQLRAAFQQGGGLPAVDAAARQRAPHVARFADLDATFAEAMRICRPRPLVLAGHSMGAQTTMMEAGAVPLIGGMGSNRFDGYVALSPQGVGTTYAAGAWSGVSHPVLMVTGTGDRTADGDYSTRQTAFEGLPPGRKRFAVLPGAGHLQIGGLGSGAPAATVNALVAEFADQIARNAWGPSRVGGATIREK
jgi:pimeloyl-ACP methyl ester carboxylesterase